MVSRLSVSILLLLFLQPLSAEEGPLFFDSGDLKPVVGPAQKAPECVRRDDKGRVLGLSHDFLEKREAIIQDSICNIDFTLCQEMHQRISQGPTKEDQIAMDGLETELLSDLSPTDIDYVSDAGNSVEIAQAQGEWTRAETDVYGSFASGAESALNESIDYQSNLLWGYGGQAKGQLDKAGKRFGQSVKKQMQKRGYYRLQRLGRLKFQRYVRSQVQQRIQGALQKNLTKFATTALGVFSPYQVGLSVIQYGAIAAADTFLSQKTTAARVGDCDLNNFSSKTANVGNLVSIAQSEIDCEQHYDKDDEPVGAPYLSVKYTQKVHDFLMDPLKDDIYQAKILGRQPGYLCAQLTGLYNRIRSDREQVVKVRSCSANEMQISVPHDSPFIPYVGNSAIVTGKFSGNSTPQVDRVAFLDHPWSHKGNFATTATKSRSPVLWVDMPNKDRAEMSACIPTNPDPSMNECFKLYSTNIKKNLRADMQKRCIAEAPLGENGSELCSRGGSESDIHGRFNTDSPKEIDIRTKESIDAIKTLNVRMHEAALCCQESQSGNQTSWGANVCPSYMPSENNQLKSYGTGVSR